MKSSHTAEVLDVAALLETVQGDRELLAELIGLFERELPEMLGELHRAVNATDAAALQRAAHTLKGATGNFGRAAAFSALERLESLARNSDFFSVRNVLPDAEREIERLLSALAPFRFTRQSSARETENQERS